MKLVPRIGNTNNVELYGLQIRRNAVVTARIYVENGDATDVYMCAVRADFTEQKRVGESDETAKNNGQELINEGMIQAKIGAGEWANICGWSNKIQLGPINEQNYVDVSLRCVFPSGADSAGTVYAGLAFRLSGSPREDTMIDATSGVTVLGAGLSGVNQTYTLISPGYLLASNGAYLRFYATPSWSGWSMTAEPPIINPGSYFSPFGTVSQIPVAGWRNTNRQGRILPNPILTEA